MCCLYVLTTGESGPIRPFHRPIWSGAPFEARCKSATVTLTRQLGGMKIRLRLSSQSTFTGVAAAASGRYRKMQGARFPGARGQVVNDEPADVPS